MKFKVGDRVKCNVAGPHFITGERYLEKGQTYTVLEIGYDSLRVVGSTEWWAKDRFIAVPRTVTDFED